jgi:hypothetical protein
MAFIRRLNGIKSPCEWHYVISLYIAEGQYTDAIDSAILKIAKAPVRKVKITA